MAEHFSYPTRPTYMLGALPVYRVLAKDVYPRPVGQKPRLLVAHGTDGHDSRAWLQGNPDRTSAHYLIGYWSGRPGVEILKYASEEEHYTNTQGYGSLGGILGNLNHSSISVEYEDTPLRPGVMDAYVFLLGSIIRTWRARGVELLLIGHRHIDSRKRDPKTDWNRLAQAVYLSAARV